MISWCKILEVLHDFRPVIPCVKISSVTLLWIRWSVWCRAIPWPVVFSLDYDYKVIFFQLCTLGGSCSFFPRASLVLVCFRLTFRRWPAFQAFLPLPTTPQNLHNQCTYSRKNGLSGNYAPCRHDIIRKTQSKSPEKTCEFQDYKIIEGFSVQNPWLSKL